MKYYISEIQCKKTEPDNYFGYISILIHLQVNQQQLLSYSLIIVKMLFVLFCPNHETVAY